MAEKRCRFTLRIPAVLNEKLDKEVEYRGYCKNALIVKLLWEYLGKNDEEELPVNSGVVSAS